MIDPRLYQLVVEQARDYAVFVLDTEGRVMTWNLGAERLKGYRPEDIIGRHFSTFYTREAVDSGWPAYELKVAATEGRFEDEGWRIRKDGSRFWANVSITALRDEDGKLLGFSKITRDMTERKLHEEAIRQSEERFRLLVEGVQDYAVYLLDLEGIVTSWNSGAQRIKGYTRDEIIRKHFSRFYTPEDIQAGKPWEMLSTARRTGRAEHEGWRVRKDGERFWARAVLTALYDSAGHLRGFAKVTQDLTERRQLRDLESAAKNVNEFLALLAHELRNPLAPIRAAVEVMGRGPALDPTQQKMRDAIDRQSTHLVRLVDDLLDIARISRGVLSIEHEPVDMVEVVRRAIEAATPAMTAGKHELSVALPPDALLVRGDMHRLMQLLTNLLNNAARYTPEHGAITVRAATAVGYVVVTVRDTGRGIEPQMMPRIFDMFFQGSTSPRKGGGLGIGLALARKIAELHGGSLEAHSEGADKGSEFVLRIPMLGQGEVRGPAPVDAVPPSPVPRRVLVVDDNVDAATTLGLLLKSLGHEPCLAHDGASALKMAVDFRPDIILLDIGMPGLDGYEVARRLREMKQDRPFRIIAITGWGQDADREKSHEAGFDLHLVKPVDRNDLVKALAVRGGATLH